jgi:Ca2+-binding RTX toxin-like protein
MYRAGILIAVLGAVLYWAPGAQAFKCGTRLDAFTRANGTNLGPNWTEQAPDPAIVGGAFTDPAARQEALATYDGISSTEACVDIFHDPGGVNFVAIVLRYANLSPDNVFLKIQDNLAPHNGFDSVWFYKGNNGQAWTAPQFHAVPVFTAARFHAVVNGTNARVEIDTNFDNQPEISLTQPGLPTSGLGDLFGLGVFGGAKLDNFSIPTREVPDTPRFTCRGKTATDVGSGGRDFIKGTRRRDVIVGLGARDLLRGRGGKDLICGGKGRDKLVGGRGRDRLYGEGGRDTLAGGKAKDRLFGQAGRDVLRGGARNDKCRGGAGRDVATSC